MNVTIPIPTATSASTARTLGTVNPNGICGTGECERDGCEHIDELDTGRSQVAPAPQLAPEPSAPERTRRRKSMLPDASWS